MDLTARLPRARDFLAEHHPLAHHLCVIGDVPAPVIDLNPYMRIEAHSLRTNDMELAMVSSGVHGVEDRPNTVVYFDMRRHEQGLPPLAVDNYNARYDLLMFPLLHKLQALLNDLLQGAYL